MNYFKNTILSLMLFLSFASMAFARDFDHRGYDHDRGRVFVGPPAIVIDPFPLFYNPQPIYYPPMIAAPVGYWYYCQSPAGYYPYVGQCSVPWMTVQAR